MAYTYDPSQSIQQGLGKASADIGGAFTAVIAQQQRDYNLAENTFQNIEALKKNLNIFGQKNITAKSNELLAQTSSAILKDGKLDYAKLGEMRQQISSIGDLKAGYDIGAKEYERMLQLGIANKDNLLSFEKFYKDLSAKMGDESLVRNPQDLQKAMADTYSSNLDSAKMIGVAYLKNNPYQKVSQDIIDPKTGAMNRVQSELPAGWTLDARGNKVPPAPQVTIVNGQTVTLDYADQELARIQATNPDMLTLIRKQAGFAGQNISDKEIIKSLIDKTPTTTNVTQVRSANQIKGEELTVTKGTFDAEHQGEKFDAEMNQSRASAASAWATAKYTLSKADQQEVDTLYDPFKDYTKVQFKGGSTGGQVNLTKFPMGRDIGLNVNGQQALVKSVARDENGGVWVEALQGRGGTLLPVWDKSDKRSLFKWRKVSNFDEFNSELSREISTGAGMSTKQQAKTSKAIGTLFSLPVNRSHEATIPKSVPKGKYD